jgi:hypothetical protein
VYGMNVSSFKELHTIHKNMKRGRRK